MVKLEIWSETFTPLMHFEFKTSTIWSDIIRFRKVMLCCVSSEYSTENMVFVLAL